MHWVSIAGTLAALCSMISFVPRAWRVVRTRDTRSISPLTYSFNLTGFALWTAYGAGLGEWPLIITNSFCFLLSAFILCMTLPPQREKQIVAAAIDPSAPAEMDR